jgi:dipeptidyl-peptidase-4
MASRCTGRQMAALAALTALAAGGMTSRAQTPALTVERIASLPSLIGTAPTAPAWSPDSTRVAFLWNDQGMPFRDVWVADAATATPARLTRFADDQAPPAADDVSLRGLIARQAGRANGGVSELVWAPDGRSLVISYRGDLHRVPLDGSPTVPLTRSGGGKSQIAFSPNGRFVSYLQNGDLWLWHAATDAVVRATTVGLPPIGTTPGGSFYANDVDVRSPRWSPDSTRIALTYEDRRQVRTVPFPNYIGDETSMNLARRGYPGDPGAPRAVVVYSVPDGIARFVDLPERSGRNILGHEWSPDGGTLLVEQDSDDGETRWLYTVRTADGAIRELLRDRRERRMYSIFNSTWSSDGQSVLFIDDSSRHYRLASIPLAGGPVSPLTDDSFDVAAERGATSLTVVAKTGQVFFVSSQKNPYERQVYRVSERGGAVTQVSSLEGVHAPVLAPDGTRLALLHSSDLSPTELYLLGPGTPERRVTRSPLKEFGQYTWSKPRYVTFKSRIDSFTLHGRLVMPPRFDPSRKYPVVLGSVYNNTVRNEWRGRNQTLQQFMALEGQYLNLQVDLRGSVGHGVAFREAFQGDWGGGDLEDLHSAVDYLKTLPYVDAGRIGIWGSSYGGMMALFALFEKPGMFKAGVAGAPAIEVSRFTSGDQHLSRRPNSHPEIFRKSTLLNYGEKLQDHLLLIHGMQDDIVPFKSTIMMAEKLMTLGKDFDLAVAPRSPHGWTRQEHYAVFMMRKLVQHFDRYLGPGPTQVSSQGQ